jgi:hypothetical protein
MISIHRYKTTESLHNNGVDDKHAHGFNIHVFEINVVFKFGPVELMVGLYKFELTGPVGL